MAHGLTGKHSGVHGSAVHSWVPMSLQCAMQSMAGLLSIQGSAWLGSYVTVQDIEHRPEITCLPPNNLLFPSRPQLLKVPQLPQIVPLVRAPKDGLPPNHGYLLIFFLVIDPIVLCMPRPHIQFQSLLFLAAWSTAMKL